jgi:hypothetical protein
LSYLYSPPTWRNVQQMEGALRYGVPTSTLVYRSSGVWHNTMTAGMDDPAAHSDTVSGLLLFFTRPTVVPDSLFAEMTASALTPADPSWTAGTLALLP